VKIRFATNFSFYFALYYEQTSPLDVPSYAFGQGPPDFSLSVLHYFSPSFTARKQHRTLPEKTNEKLSNKTIDFSNSL